MKQEKRMSVMLVVRTETCDYKYFCDNNGSQEEDFAKMVAFCLLNNISYTTDVVLFDVNHKIVDRFGYEE